MKVVVLATLNPGKVREMREILKPFRLNLISLRDVPSVAPPEEQGVTFRENAVTKASYYSKETRLPCIADDSGLQVDVLEGGPGIYSSRFAGEEASDEENVNMLLDVLAGHPRPWTARFVCCAAYAEAGRVIAAFDGVLEGEIVPEKRGSSGFGYDPVFFLRDRELTVAEMNGEQKNMISHRRKAVDGLMHVLRGKKIL